MYLPSMENPGDLLSCRLQAAGEGMGGWAQPGARAVTCVFPSAQDRATPSEGSLDLDCVVGFRSRCGLTFLITFGLEQC